MKTIDKLEQMRKYFWLIEKTPVLFVGREIIFQKLIEKCFLC